MNCVNTPTDHEKREWARLAQAAYHTCRNAAGHTFSAAAALPAGATMDPQRFQKLQDGYRAWLVFGWVEFDTTPIAQTGAWGAAVLATGAL